LARTTRVASVDERDPILSCSDGTTWYLSRIDWAEAVTWRVADELDFLEERDGLYDWRIRHRRTGCVVEAMALAARGPQEDPAPSSGAAVARSAGWMRG
jgi:hypothetical protein